MRVTPNYRNLELNGPTTRAVNLTKAVEKAERPNAAESIRAQFTNSRNNLFEFSPNEPDFGFVKEGCVYNFPIKLQHMGRDVVRFRIVQPTNNNDDGGLTRLRVISSTTKIIPGLVVNVVLQLTALTPGVFNFTFDVVSELEAYAIDVVGHVLTNDDFNALAPLQKFGRQLTTTGVKLVEALIDKSSVGSFNHDTTFIEEGEEEGQGEGEGEGGQGEDGTGGAADQNEEERDSILGLFTQDQIDEAAVCPTFSNMYWDKNTDMMCLYPSEIVVDEKKTLDEVVKISTEKEEKIMAKLELSGILSSRCLEYLKVDQKVKRTSFRLLSSKQR